jgi:hypothetical protein
VHTFEAKKFLQGDAALARTGRHKEAKHNIIAVDRAGVCYVQ